MSAIDEDFRMHTQPKSEKEMVLIDPVELASLNAENEALREELGGDWMVERTQLQYALGDLQAKLNVLCAENDRLTKAVEEARRAANSAKANLDIPFPDGRPVAVTAAIYNLNDWLAAHEEKDGGFCCCEKPDWVLDDGFTFYCHACNGRVPPRNP